MRRRIARELIGALERAQAGGVLPQFEAPLPVVAPPSRAEHGDYATNYPLQLAKPARENPQEIGRALVDHLERETWVGKVEVAPPGFINFHLDDGWVAQQVETILAAGDGFGRSDLGEGQRVQVEHGSANPTGPLTLGSGRNVVLGDTLSNALEFAGYEVQREYYVNDAGVQMRLFGESLFARYAQALGRKESVPDGGYQGPYLEEWGRKLAEEEGERYLEIPREEAAGALRATGVKWVLEGIRHDLETLGISYERWFSETSLYEDGTFDEVLSRLTERGLTGEREGALWFQATDLGADKDEVIVKSDGDHGYFASEIAYVYDKFLRRGFDWAVYVLGADHHWHAARTRTIMEALGIEPDRLRAIIYQLVALKRSGEAVRLSKRTGDIITLREVIEEVGSDATRFLLLSHAAETHMEFDLDLAKIQSQENPVYYVQYAHARIASVLRYAGDRDISDGDVSLLIHPAEQRLIRHLISLGDIVELIAQSLEPHHLTYYAQDLAAAFHSFYNQCRVVSSDPEDEDITRARLKLATACKIVLGTSLRLMGVSAPETM
ncbi:MAG: arginine--tRNA ligase [Anaerolineae bacterium]